mmetsp:Transcript_19063/g.38879  ORF Transcript_19063/g.38879 Transcript_19063/m.38879 type:complete len:299 (-) Transcript_19063:691-1587(-)
MDEKSKQGLRFVENLYFFSSSNLIKLFFSHRIQSFRNNISSFSKMRKSSLVFKNDLYLHVTSSLEKIYQQLKFFASRDMIVEYYPNFLEISETKNAPGIIRSLNLQQKKINFFLKKKIYFFIENFDQSIRNFSETLKKNQNFFFIFLDKKIKKLKKFNELKSPFIRIKKTIRRGGDPISFYQKQLIIKTRAPLFDFFALISGIKIKKIIFLTSNFVISQKTKALLRIMGKKSITLGPWLPKERILKKLKIFNSNLERFLILSTKPPAFLNIFDRIDKREVPFFFQINNRFAIKRKVFF